MDHDTQNARNSSARSHLRVRLQPQKRRDSDLDDGRAWQGQGSAAQPQDRALHPPTCLQVYCNARIDATMESDPHAVVDCMTRLYAVMAGKPMPESVRTNAEETCRREKRVVVRLKPYATFETPPRHVYSEQDTVGLTHSLGQLMPWN